MTHSSKQRAPSVGSALKDKLQTFMPSRCHNPLRPNHKPSGMVSETSAAIMASPLSESSLTRDQYLEQLEKERHEEATSASIERLEMNLRIQELETRLEYEVSKSEHMPGIVGTYITALSELRCNFGRLQSMGIYFRETLLNGLMSDVGVNRIMSTYFDLLDNQLLQLQQLEQCLSGNV